MLFFWRRPPSRWWTCRSQACVPTRDPEQGRGEDREPGWQDSEYLLIGEFFGRTRLIFSSAIVCNNPGTVMNHLDRVKETRGKSVISNRRHVVLMVLLIVVVAVAEAVLRCEAFVFSQLHRYFRVRLL